MNPTDVSDEVEHKNARAGLGWQTEELWHQGQKIGMWGFFGVRLNDPNYYYTEEKEGDNTRIKIFQKERVEPQVPLA